MYSKLLSTKEIIQILNTLKAAMGVWDQTFKNCLKWMEAYKEWGSNFDKYLSPLNNLLKTEIFLSLYKIEV